jgi:hypothetical protein
MNQGRNPQVASLNSNTNRQPDGSGCDLRKIDITWAVALFAIALVLRMPFRSQFAYHWDSAQFALAVGEYNLHTGQPHAPGFYLYVLLGKLINLFVGDPHTALVWLSVFAGAGLVVVGYLLATLMFGRGCGWVTGLILLTSPLCWFHSEIALTTIVDSALVVSFVFVCWRAIQQRVTWFQAILLAVLLAAVAGVRQQSAPLLIPLWVYVFGSFARPRGLKFACATMLAAGLCLLWFVPTVKSAGGLAQYFELLRLKSQFDAPRTVWRDGGVGALLTNVSWIGRSCWVGLLGASIILVIEFVHWVFVEDPQMKDNFYRSNRVQLCLLGLWVTPMLLFWTFMYVTMPGYVLNFFPAVVILASLGLVKFSKRLPIVKAGRLAVVLGTVVAINVPVFLCMPPEVTSLSMGLNISRREIREHDIDLLECFRTIRQRWPAKDVVVYHYYEDFYWGFRQFEYYLPEYRNVLLVADGSLPPPLSTEKWVGQGRQTTFVREIPIFDKTDIVLVVPTGQSLDIFKPQFDIQRADLVLEARVKLYLIRR